LRKREGSTRESWTIPLLEIRVEGGLDDCSPSTMGYGYGCGGFADFAMPTQESPETWEDC